MTVYNQLLEKIAAQGAAYLVLIDPDKFSKETAPDFLGHCAEAGVDALLVGGSLLIHGVLEETLQEIKQHSSLPTILFPGSVNQLSKLADALLYISLISGRNAEHLIGKQVIAAPMIKQMNIEPISTGYMLIESSNKTTAEYISGSQPIPRNKPEIAMATALAAEYLGMKFVYLEAGSGAKEHVPFEMIQVVSRACSIPVIAGGGIRTPETAARMVSAGAKLIVTGNHFESAGNWTALQEFAEAVHWKSPRAV
jgi:putative glycerol-1-phosphate prenyltransferase